MYAAAPCYNLPKLHRVIEHELPPSPKGILATWKEINKILKRQKIDPGYQFEAKIPMV